MRTHVVPDSPSNPEVQTPERIITERQILVIRVFTCLEKGFTQLILQDPPLRYRRGVEPLTRETTFYTPPYFLDVTERTRECLTGEQR